MTVRLGRSDPISAVVAEGFFSRLSFGIISFVLPLQALRLGASLPSIAILLSLNTIVAMVFKLPAGALADRIGTRAMLLIAVAMRSVVSLALIFSGSLAALYAIRVLHGISIALRDPATASLIAEHGGKNRIASTFAWYQTSKTVAGAIGKGIGGVLLGLGGSAVGLPYVVAFVLSCIPLVLVGRSTGQAVAPAEADLHINPPEPDPSHPLGTEVLPPHPADFGAVDEASIDTTNAGATSDGRLVAAAAGLGLLISATAYMVTNLFPLIAVEHAGLTEAQAGMILMLGAVAGLSGPAFGHLADRSGNRAVLRIRSGANVGSSLLYLFAPTLAGVAVARLADDVGKAAFKPAWGAVTARLANLDPRRRARTMSKVSLGEDAGEVIAPLLAAALWSRWGIAALFGARIALAVTTEVYSNVLERRLGVIDGSGGRVPSRAAWRLFGHSMGDAVLGRRLSPTVLLVMAHTVLVLAIVAAGAGLRVVLDEREYQRVDAALEHEVQALDAVSRRFLKPPGTADGTIQSLLDHHLAAPPADDQVTLIAVVSNRVVSVRTTVGQVVDPSPAAPPPAVGAVRDLVDDVSWVDELVRQVTVDPTVSATARPRTFPTRAGDIRAVALPVVSDAEPERGFLIVATPIEAQRRASDRTIVAMTTLAAGLIILNGVGFTRLARQRGPRPAAYATEAQRPAAPPQPQRPKALIVDDDDHLTWMLHEHLTGNGWSVLTAADASLADFLASTEHFDLVIAAAGDIGTDRACEWLDRLVRTIDGNLIVLDGVGEPEARKALCATGAAAVLAKPVDIDQFGAIVDRLQPARDHT